MTTDTSERGLERLICTALTGSPCDPGGVDAGAADAVHAVFAVVVLGIAADPAGAVGSGLLVDRVRCSSIRTAPITGRPGQRRADQPFQAAFAGVGGHAASPPIKQPSSNSDGHNS